MSSIGRQHSEGRFVATWTEGPERRFGPTSAQCVERDRPAATREGLPQAAAGKGEDPVDPVVVRGHEEQVPAGASGERPLVRIELSYVDRAVLGRLVDLEADDA